MTCSIRKWSDELNYRTVLLAQIGICSRIHPMALRSIPPQSPASSMCVSRLLPKSLPLLVRAVLGGRRYRSSSHHRSIFHFPLVLSCLPTHLFSIPSITCVFNPLFPLMSLSEIVYCQCSVYLYRCATGLRTHICLYSFFLLVLWSMLLGHLLKYSILHSV